MILPSRKLGQDTGSSLSEILGTARNLLSRLITAEIRAPSIDADACAPWLASLS